MENSLVTPFLVSANVSGLVLPFWYANCAIGLRQWQPLFQPVGVVGTVQCKAELGPLALLRALCRFQTLIIGPIARCAHLFVGITQVSPMLSGMY